MSKIKILIVTHKDFKAPTSDIYLPICVGVGRDALKDKYQPDNTGDNISEKNIRYCELTALYWAWKNLNCDIVGLSHYRRLFSMNANNKNIDTLISENDVVSLLSKCDCIVVPKKIYLQSVKNHYINCIKSRKQANKVQLDLLRETICEKSPQYLNAYDQVMNGHSAHMLNMFIMPKQVMNEYCLWLFDILFELERKIEEHNVMFDRVMGAFSEFLLDVWMIGNHKKMIDVNMLETEKDFWKKLIWALKRKLVE